MLWHNSRISAAIHSKFADLVTAVNMQTCNNTTLAKVGGRHISNPPKKRSHLPQNDCQQHHSKSAAAKQMHHISNTGINVHGLLLARRCCSSY